MEAFETFEHAGMTVKLYQDDAAEDPFETFDQLAELVWTDREHAYKNVDGQVSLDTEHYYDPDRHTSTAHLQRYLTLMEGYLVAVPFRLMDYGSGGARVDVVDVSSERVSGFLVVSEKRRELVGAPLEGLQENAMNDFRQWKAWVEGNVTGYVVEDPDGEVLDSCWGYYGEVDYARGEAKAAATTAAQIFLESPPCKPIRVELEQLEARAVLSALMPRTLEILDTDVLEAAHRKVAEALADREQEEAAALERVAAGMPAVDSDDRDGPTDAERDAGTYFTPDGVTA